MFIKAFYHESEQPRAKLIAFLRFAKSVLRDIQYQSFDSDHWDTSLLAGKCFYLLQDAWESAIHDCSDPCDDLVKISTMKEPTEDAIFQMALERDIDWLRENWRTALPSGKEL